MKTHSQVLAFALSLLILPVAMAGGAKKLETMDANGDGKVSRVEYRKAAETTFRQMDKNRDGVVSAKELNAAVEQLDGDKVAYRAKWRAMDRNADGRISGSEQSSATYTEFSEMDTDKDGVLTQQELEAAHQRASQESDS